LAKSGDKVKVHYTGRLQDGTVFDSSVDSEPLEFTLGAGSTIAGFEKAVLELEVGQSQTVTIPAAEAYGPYNEQMVMTFNLKELPAGMNPQLGDRLGMRAGNGETAVVTVIDLTKTMITVDANHELAGKDLTFEIKLVEVS
jgi:peptidylprolyl isomerase